MSKIGRIPIALKTAKIEIQGNILNIKGPNAHFAHELPACLTATVVSGALSLTLNDASVKEGKCLWGLHRALLANKVKGAEVDFEQKMTIVGLGYKAVLTGKKMTFSLGYTHKIEYDLPDGVKVDIDRTGQIMVIKAADRFVLGNVCDTIRSFRPPEPYKGTGIIREGEVVIRKAGKTK